MYLVVVQLSFEGRHQVRFTYGPAATLTPAERAVVALALEGCSNQEIARRRGASARTIANQLASAYRKLGVSGRAELAALGARR